MSWVTWNRREPAGTYDRLTRMAEWAYLMLLKSTKNVFDIWWWRISWHQNVVLFYNPSCLPCFACRRFPPLSAVITLNQAKIVNIIFTNNKLQYKKKGERKKSSALPTPGPVLELMACLCFSCWRLLRSRTRWWITIFLRIIAYLGQLGGWRRKHVSLSSNILAHKGKGQRSLVNKVASGWTQSSSGA